MTMQKELLDRWIRGIERDIHVTSCRGNRSCDYQLFVSREDEDYDHMARFSSYKIQLHLSENKMVDFVY